MTLVEKARQFAHEAHDSINQKRKYTGEPYWVHTDEVANLVAVRTNDEEVIAAANLHDLEDVFPLNSAYTLHLVEKEFGLTVAFYVSQLTNNFTKESFPHLGRKARKDKERNRLAGLSPNAQTIKIADIISNSRGLVKADKEFAEVYIPEQTAKLLMLTEGNKTLFYDAILVLAAEWKQL